MFNIRNLQTRAHFDKDLVSDQTWHGLSVELNNSIDFDIDGLTQSSSNSSVLGINVGGFDDQRIVLHTLTKNGTPDFGPILRMQWYGTQDNALYYWARLTSNSCRIVLVDERESPSFITLTQASYSPADDEVIEIEFTAVGSALYARFNSSSGGEVELSVPDLVIPNGGLMGFRTFSQPASFQQVEAWQI